MIRPFVARHGRNFQQRRRSDPNAYELYLWAVAIVAAYSFELGGQRFQVRDQHNEVCDVEHRGQLQNLLRRRAFRDPRKVCICHEKLCYLRQEPGLSENSGP